MVRHEEQNITEIDFKFEDIKEYYTNQREYEYYTQVHENQMLKLTLDVQ